MSGSEISSGFAYSANLVGLRRVPGILRTLRSVGGCPSYWFRGWDLLALSVRAWCDFHACNWHQKTSGLRRCLTSGVDSVHTFWPCIFWLLGSRCEDCVRLDRLLADFLPSGGKIGDIRLRDTLVQYAARLILYFMLFLVERRDWRWRRNSIPITLARTVLHLFFSSRYGKCLLFLSS